MRNKINAERHNVNIDEHILCDNNANLSWMLTSTLYWLLRLMTYLLIILFIHLIFSLHLVVVFLLIDFCFCFFFRTTHSLGKSNNQPSSYPFIHGVSFYNKHTVLTPLFTTNEIQTKTFEVPYINIFFFFFLSLYHFSLWIIVSFFILFIFIILHFYFV